MQTKQSQCIFCSKEILISKHASGNKSKCSECHKIWHKLRNKKNEYGENTSVNDLVLWYISQEQKCVECGAKNKITIDRIRPQKLGGKYEVGNVQLLCYTCNCCKKIGFNSVMESQLVPLTRKCTVCKVEKTLKTCFHKSAHKNKYKKGGVSEYNPICKECRGLIEAKVWAKTHTPTRKVKHILAYNK